MQVRMTVGGVALALLLWGPLGTIEAQVTGPGPDGRWPLQPASPGSRTLAPFLEGWYANEDGSFSLSFGYNNLNQDTIYIPVGEGNFLEPAQFDGMQPTIFFPGKHRGVFTAELPAEMQDTDVWWTITRPNGDVTKVPGRVSSTAYQLDWYPRPHGSLPPRVSFDSQDGEGRGPPGLLAERPLTASMGSPLTLSVNTRDISERDRSDTRFAENLSVRVTWEQLQGPGRVEYTRHESNPLPEAAEGGRGGRGGRGGGAPRPQVIRLEEGYGTAQVIATFTEPGEYLMRARVDNFSATDSNDGDQCCWTNGYVRVTVR